VLVNEVLDGKALLIRPFGTMNTMADTLGSSIAWIRENVISHTPHVDYCCLYIKSVTKCKNFSFVDPA
jgi:hypothetical protein